MKGAQCPACHLLELRIRYMQTLRIQNKYLSLKFWVWTNLFLLARLMITLSSFCSNNGSYWHQSESVSSKYLPDLKTELKTSWTAFFLVNKNWLVARCPRRRNWMKSKVQTSRNSSGSHWLRRAEWPATNCKSQLHGAARTKATSDVFFPSGGWLSIPFSVVIIIIFFLIFPQGK